VEPDRHVTGPIEGFNPTTFGRMLYSRQEFENFAQKFMAEGDTRITQQSSGRRSVTATFVVDDAMIEEFRGQLKTGRLRIDEDAFQKDLPFIKAMIRYRISEVLFGIAEAKRQLFSVDPQGQIALSMFSEAEKLSGRVVRAN
jgi:hypothetical protein